MEKKTFFTVRNLALIGVLAAIVFVLTKFISIPIPSPLGKTALSVGNAMCVLSALLFGPAVGGLAAGIGNIHGVYPANWKGLDFDALQRIHEATNHIPLVLHGGTGIPDEMIAKAISLGVCKININTECQLVFAEATRKYIEAGKDLQGKGFDPRKLLAPGAQAIIDKCKEKIELFGCAGKG